MPELRITLKTYLAHLQDTKNIHLSVNQLSKESGLPQSTVSKIVNNSIDGISRHKLAAIIAALRKYDADVNIKDIITFVP